MFTVSNCCVPARIDNEYIHSLLQYEYYLIKKIEKVQQYRSPHTAQAHSHQLQLLAVTAGNIVLRMHMLSPSHVYGQSTMPQYNHSGKPQSIDLL